MAVPRLQILGPLRAWYGDEELDLGPAKQRAVLAMLLLHPGSSVRREEIIDVLWGDSPPASVVNVIQTYMTRLRGRLASGGTDGRPFTGLRAVQGGYLLETGEDQLDLLRFRRLSGQARQATHDEEALELCVEALRIWQGRCLADLTPELRAHPSVTAVNAERVECVLTACRTALRLGEAGTVLPHLRAVASAEPLHEAVQAQLILALAATGAQAEAITGYQAVRERLAEDLGVDPGPLLQEALAQVLHQQVPATEPSSAHRAGAAQDGGMLRQPHGIVPAQLPATVGDFTGRDEHIKELSDLLVTEAGPSAERGAGPTGMVVAAIRGRGGVGKSTLAVHVAHRVAGDFPDGRLYANLRGATADPADPAELLARFLRALGLDGGSLPTELEELTALFRSRLADRRILLVLDDAADERQVRPLLPGTRSCGVIVTSRAALGGLEGAYAVDLDVFELDQAVRLFTMVVGDRRVAAEPETAREIVRLCGRLPLAVRIAAARLAVRPGWSLARLAGRLADERRRLDELAVGDLEVRASLALSRQGLTPDAQRLLGLLGLLEAPDFASWVAALLLDTTPDHGERLMEELVKARLIDEHDTDATGHLRYRLHDLVRLYARECAEAEERPDARHAALARTFGALLTLAEQADLSLGYTAAARITGGAPRHPVSPDVVTRLLADPLAWFEGERDFLLAAAHQAASEAMDDLAWELAAAATNFLSLRGYFPCLRQAHQRGLDACQQSGHLLGQAVALRGLAEAAAGMGRDDEVLAAIERAAVLFSEAGEPRGETDALNLWAQIHLDRGRPSDSLTLSRRALSTAAACGYGHGEYFALRSLGTVRRHQGRFDEAARAFDSCLRLARQLGDTGNYGGALLLLGIVRREQHRYEESEALLIEALETFRPDGNAPCLSMALLQLGVLYTQWERPQARPLVEESLALARGLCHRYQIARGLVAVGTLDRLEGRLESARNAVRESIDTWRSLDTAYELAPALEELGHIHHAHGDQDLALTTWQEAHDIYTKLGNHHRITALTSLLSNARPPHFLCAAQ